MELLQRLESWLDKVPKSAVYVCAALGLLSLSRSVLPVLQDFYHFHLQSIPNYAAKYGKGSYVLITGASDGIGEQLAYYFASQGFNLVLIARSQEKLDKVKAKCVLTHCVHVVDIIQDLNTLDAAVFTRIAAQVSSLDISILVNNAGVLIRSPLPVLSQEEVLAQINVNVMAPTLLTRALLPKMLDRPQRGLVINLSSMLARIPAGYVAVYSATKAYMRAFSLALAQELSGKIDVFAACPSSVSTKLIGNPEVNCTVAALNVTVQGILTQAPRQLESFCSFKHAWIYYKLSFLSFASRIRINTAIVKGRYEAAKAKV